MEKLEARPPVFLSREPHTDKSKGRRILRAQKDPSKGWFLRRGAGSERVLN